jgi:S-DNA-T family DNA segregation ATPase FtsK/SpoIIIE
MSKTECTACAGLGKQLVRKNGVVKMITCKSCAGKGKVITVQKKKSIKDKKEQRATREDAMKRLNAKHRKAAQQKRAVEMDEDDEDEDDDFEEVLHSSKHHAEKPAMPIKKMKLTEDQQLAKETIEERAEFFGCPGKVTGIRKGPVITLYEFAPGKVTRIKRLASLQEDLALALSAEAVMVRRIPGRDVVGIEISNEPTDRQNVAFRASLKNVAAAKKAGMELPLNLGTDPFGDPIIDDLATMPHLLMAGSTGAGKSVALNCLISSLLAVCSPDELQFYMIDPKGVELIHYDGIPHLVEQMVKSPHHAKQLLENLIREMRSRLAVLAHAGVRDLRELNDIRKAKGEKPMPRIVVVVDELGDLMLQDRRAFIALFAEISQIARATGIHMICATQRPSVDVLPGKVKVNFPGRMAFKVTSMADSKTIVHRKGAEGLLGRGDMLYLSPSRSSTIRVHAPWVPLEDVKELANKIRAMEAKRLEEERKKQEELEKKMAAERAKQMEQFNSMPKVAVPTLPQGQKESIDLELSWMDDVKVLPMFPKPRRTE